VPERQFTDAELHAALEQLTPERFREWETRIAQMAPQLQRTIVQIMHESGWFDETHEAAVLKAATTPDEDERLTAVRTLIAEEARTVMFVGVAVGWELAKQLEELTADDTEGD
jgi:phosphohistidine swiveling domain-containing protein